METFAKLLLLSCMGASATISTGVSGVVHISPAHPGPQRVGESGSAPMTGAAVQARDANDRVVARAVTGADGRFSISLPAGDYRLSIDTGGAALPRCGEVHTTVRDGHVADVEIECDSGMR